MTTIVLPRKPGLFRYSKRDAIPVAFGIVHLCYLVSLFLVFTFFHPGWKVKVPLMAVMGIVYSFSISWNINGISHNFIHNRYFNSPLLNWKFMLFFLPFWYFGHCLSYLNGYFEHFGGNPDIPIAWGVSTYHRLYNLVWFNNGYHAEHHYRPRAHWTRMEALKQEIEARQREAGVRVIKPPHAFGFLDPDVCDEPMVPTQKMDDAPDADDLVDVTMRIAELKGAA